jgi:hypothetical protein
MQIYYSCNVVMCTDITVIEMVNVVGMTYCHIFTYIVSAMENLNFLKWHCYQPALRLLNCQAVMLVVTRPFCSLLRWPKTDLQGPVLSDSDIINGCPAFHYLNFKENLNFVQVH